jgi:predicted enzyme related to lactoylglutathione lyase
MGELNSQVNRVVWVDVPVVDLDRAVAFYRAVLKNDCTKEKYGDYEFGLLDHKDGNGGCLVKGKEQVTSTGGLLVYFNADGRIRDAAAQVEKLGGKVIEQPHAIGPHGFRAVIVDSEGNRIALHSTTDA